MAIVLSEIFGAKPIINTVELLAATNHNFIPQNQLIADFAAKTRHPGSGQEWTLIAESKGSLGRVVSKMRTRHAKEQAAATKARFTGTSARLPLAFCSSVYFAKQAKHASCKVVDPPSEVGHDDVLINPADAWRAAYSKAFRFVGLDIASDEVATGRPIRSLQRMIESGDQPTGDREQQTRRRRRAAAARERFNADLVLDAGPCAISIDPKLLSLLEETGINAQMAGDLEHMADIRRHEDEPWTSRSFMNYLGIGCLFYDDLDQA
jgi:hypothetical protein